MFFIVVSFINLCVAIYLSFSLIWSLKVKSIIKVFLTAGLFLLSQKFWLEAIPYEFVRGVTTSSFWFVFNGWMQVALFISFGIAVGIDIVAYVLKIFKKRLLYRIPLIVMLSLIITTYGVYEAMKVPSVHLMSVSSELLPTDWKPVTVAVLSDLHISSTSKMEKKWLNSVVRKTNDLKADMILITGDIIDDNVATLSEQIKPLFDLRAPYGVYMSFGNHEMFNDSENWEHFFRQNGMSVLNDEVRQTNLGENTITIAGIYKNPRVLNDIQSDYPILLLAHYPAVAKKVPADTVFLQLSGHTHGGQFGILNPVIAKFNQGFVKGLYQVGQSQLYVHSGTGLWRGFPFRFLTPSEITLITIYAKKN